MKKTCISVLAVALSLYLGSQVFAVKNDGIVDPEQPVIENIAVLDNHDAVVATDLNDECRVYKTCFELDQANNLFKKIDQLGGVKNHEIVGNEIIICKSVPLPSDEINPILDDSVVAILKEWRKNDNLFILKADGAVGKVHPCKAEAEKVLFY